jgi:hypothetical protein
MNLVLTCILDAPPLLQRPWERYRARRQFRRAAGIGTDLVTLRTGSDSVEEGSPLLILGPYSAVCFSNEPHVHLPLTLRGDEDEVLIGPLEHHRAWRPENSAACSFRTGATCTRSFARRTRRSPLTDAALVLLP